MNSTAKVSRRPGGVGWLGRVNRRAGRHGLQPLLLLLAVAALALFLHVAWELLEDGDSPLDRSILLALRTPGDLAKPIGPRWLLQSAIDISALGGFTFIWLFTVVTSGYLALVRRWRSLLLYLVSVVGVSALNALVKVSFHRARPMVVPHLAQVDNASFPSGHAMISAATYLTIGALLSQSADTRGARGYLIGVSVALALMIGVSRLYLGVHWPSDVLAGWALGAAWALAFWAFARGLEPTMASSGGATRDATSHGGAVSRPHDPSDISIGKISP